MPQVVPPPIVEPLKGLSQQQRIIAIMCIHATDKKWWKAHELINAHEEWLFVGYEAGPRLSELTRKYPEIFETKQEGKFLLRRMRFETGKEWYKNAPRDIQLVVKRYYKAEQQV